MYCVRVQEEIGHRLDAEFYNPAALATEAKMRAHGEVQPLGEKIAEGYRVVYHGTDSISGFANEDLLPFLSPTQINEGGEIDFTSTDQLPSYYKDRYPKGLAVAGELLVEVKGNVAKVAVVPDEFPENLMVSGSLYKATLRPDLDSRYALAFLQSRFGQILKDRLTSNTIIQYIAKSDLYSILVFVAHKTVQRYIGDKVRQAEQLRSWANALAGMSRKAFEEALKWSDQIESAEIFGWISSAELDARLDLKYNSPKRIALKRHLERNGVTTEPLHMIADISAMIGWKGLTTEYYRDFGPWLLRGVEFCNGLIDTEALVSVDEEKYEEQPQIHLREGDVVLTKDGTLGKAVVIPKLPNRLAAGSTVARIRVKDTQYIDPYYLEFVINHASVQIQIESFSTGVAQPHITQEWIALIEIPRTADEVKIAVSWKLNHYCLSAAKGLTRGARLLVEALIEGQITEAELIDAQHALTRGDDSLDRAILARLKTDGLDGVGEPLFPDLDQLYDLLERAQPEAGA
ncbi:hypothetical protein [uncultured Lamprocystis sp.]|jgi:type I restriction enzyme S subunit|uniref:restriction endonuclease subunit S n=1 Tax=uncultured Lamprocystis sp. TaxID=543132 RepID=UPI0025D3AF99|nr:hypothetical protein [uncultured Lamprocystis sp.]